MNSIRFKKQTNNKKQTKNNKNPKYFCKCCGHKRVGNLVFSGYEVKLAVRLHWAHLWYEHVGTEELQCALPVAQAAAKAGVRIYKKELCMVGGSSWEGWRTQSVKSKASLSQEH